MRSTRVLLAAALLFTSPPAGRAAAQEGAAMDLTSSAFAAGAAIPEKYTCVGSDISPPLAWSGAPAQTRSFALVVDDPDAPDPAAPKRTWVHWVLYNLPVATTSLAEGAGNRATLPPSRSGMNDWSRPGYGGPCPPVGRHRYFFKLYALDEELSALEAADKTALEKAMEGHVLAKAELMGTFQK